MNTTHEVISDFLDGEAFEPRALGEALADPAGRELLIDFVVLRYAAQSEELLPAPSSPARRSPARLLLAVAAVFVALAGGYQLGHTRADTDSVRPPEPTRAVQAAPTWHEIGRAK